MFDFRNSVSDTSSDDDDYEMKGQALPVAPFDIDRVDESSMPLTSQEYLQQVIAQRAKLPEVVTAVVPKLSPVNNENSIAAIFTEEKVIPSTYCPTQEWQREKISNFSDLRYRIDVNREKWAQNESKNFPKTREEWFGYLFHESNDCAENQPYLSVVLSMRNELMETVIKHIVDFVMENKVTIYQSGTWFFGLLACIEVPISIKVMKKLRAFVRKCREVREQMDFNVEENKSELAAQNLFICLICKYFGQHDLSD